MNLDRFKMTINENLDNEELVQEVWRSNLSVEDKLLLSFEINDLKPSYPVLSTMWLEYSLTNEVSTRNNELIFSYYLKSISDSHADLSATTEYSLHFNIFEDPERNRIAWDFFLKQRPNEKFIKTMLQCSGPVPYELKHEVYEKLVMDDLFHLEIYHSIKYSCGYGQIEKHRARDILHKLNLNDKMDKISKDEYWDIYTFLKNKNDR
jgi:hypothetical protein